MTITYDPWGTVTTLLWGYLIGAAIMFLGLSACALLVRRDLRHYEQCPHHDEDARHSARQYLAEVRMVCHRTGLSEPVLYLFLSMVWLYLLVKVGTRR